MRPLFLLFAISVAALLIPVVARAQEPEFTVYLTSSNLRASNVVAGETLAIAGTQELYTSFWAAGVGGGVTFGAGNFEHLTLGLDIRGSFRSGTPGANTGMGGLKLGFYSHHVPLKPYVQASVGILSTNAVNLATGGNSTNTNPTFNNHYFAYEVLAGLDYKLTRLIDIRVVEIGAGQGIGVAGAGTASSATLFTVNSGITVRF